MKNKMLKVYDFAKEYLKEITPKEVDIEKYFTITTENMTLKDVFIRLISSLQNTQMMPNVIGLNHTSKNLVYKKILFDFDYNIILQNYNEESLYNCFNEYFEIKNKNSKLNLYRRYAKSIISACEFVSKFKSFEDFNDYVMSFDNDVNSRFELVKIISKEVYGMGIALACDFLKELGYSNYPKPDIHLKDIFSSLDFCNSKDDYDVYKAIVEMAELSGDTPYKVDKVFWLICSGFFYGDDIKISSHKNEFIQKAKEVLSQ